MHVRSSTVGEGIGLIEAKGSFLGGEETDALRNAVRSFVDAQCRKLIIDLGEVTYLNSSAIGVLVAASISYTRRHWQLRLCGINKVVHAMLLITKLEILFETAASREEAVRSFR